MKNPTPKSGAEERFKPIFSKKVTKTFLQRQLVTRITYKLTLFYPLYHLKKECGDLIHIESNQAVLEDTQRDEDTTLLVFHTANRHSIFVRTIIGNIPR